MLYCASTHVLSINSVYILGDGKDQHEQSMKIWSKVKDVSSDITQICQPTDRRYQINGSPMSFVASDKRLDHLDPSLMYRQIIKEILLMMIEFVDYYCDIFVDNDTDKKKVKRLEDEHHNHTPIW
ncbi:unnamed protein product [Adineta ricciae]|uniref:Uncharacterized protein n=1 Tax=Adineta ricciae TaxID=249248 RepID=A0A814BGZ3_ADIRI|nr:unnamed protein product [Adineta ricciae]CAF1426013.1 unnamed protein product [Adineta ricciae]